MVVMLCSEGLNQEEHGWVAFIVSRGRGTKERVFRKQCRIGFAFTSWSIMSKRATTIRSLGAKGNH